MESILLTGGIGSGKTDLSVEIFRNLYKNVTYITLYPYSKIDINIRRKILNHINYRPNHWSIRSSLLLLDTLYDLSNESNIIIDSMTHLLVNLFDKYNYWHQNINFDLCKISILDTYINRIIKLLNNHNVIMIIDDINKSNIDINYRIEIFKEIHSSMFNTLMGKVDKAYYVIAGKKICLN